MFCKELKKVQAAIETLKAGQMCTCTVHTPLHFLAFEVFDTSEKELDQPRSTEYAVSATAL